MTAHHKPAVIAMVNPSNAARSLIEECTNRLDHEPNATSITLRLDGVTVRCTVSKRGKVRASVTSR